MDKLRALRYVVAVAEDLSFTRAARRLGVAQPTLSRAVRAFEDAHQVVLFDRSTRAVALTDAGRALVEQAVGAIEQADRAVTAAKWVAAGVRGRVRVGFVTGAANALLPAIARELRATRPGVELDLVHSSVDEQLVALRQRRIDVGLLRLPSDVLSGDLPGDAVFGDAAASAVGGGGGGPFAAGPPAQRLVVDALIPDHLVAAVPAVGPLATGADARVSSSQPEPLLWEARHGEPRAREPLAWEALRDQPFVFWPRAMAPSLHDAIMQHLRQAGGLTPRVVLHTRDTLALLALVAADVGVTLVTAGTASAIQREGVAYRRLIDPPQVTIAVVTRPRSSPAIQAVLGACRTAAAGWTTDHSPR